MLNQHGMIFALGLLLVPALIACGGDDDSVAPNDETLEIFNAIEGYTSWANPGGSTPTVSPTHGNRFVVTYHNDVVQGAIDNNTLPLPAGSIIVKQSFESADDSEPVLLSIMSKLSSEQGDWYWVQATNDERVVLNGNDALEGREVSMCSGCHSGAADNDYLFFHSFADTLAPGEDDT